MRKIKTLVQPLLALIVLTAFFSCGGTKKTDTADTAAAAKPAAAAAAPAMKAPFDVVEITHKLKDYATWRPLFNSDSTARKAAGLTDIVVGQEIDSANNVMVVLNASDVAKAKAFAADPRLKDVMTKGGVISKPDVEYFHVIRFNPDTHEKTWVVITHKVKDFDAWVKVYDGEGTAKRVSQGMVDVALARGIDDPNLVHIVFDITDMAKAKAAIFSDEKKKLMMSAGVEGKPEIVFYKSVE